MGTRGLVGFRLNKKDYLTYNHFDSYPEGTGKRILGEIKKLPKNIKKLVKNIKLIDGKKKPTKKQIAENKMYSSITVSNESLEDWYCLLREVQGSLKPYINNELKYMIDSKDFIKDSLFCEWAYIINLDTDKLEIWQGFQEYPKEGNRYGQESLTEKGRPYKYFPCALIKEYDLNKLPSEKKFIKDLAEEEK